MAVRNVSTRLAIEGEAAYKAAITNINTELRTLQSALKLTEKEFEGNANSMAALTAKGDALKNLQDSQAKKVEELSRALDNARGATDRYASKKEELTSKIEANNRALEKLKETSEDTSEEQKKLTDENAKLNDELQKNEGYLTAAQRGVNNWETQLNTAKGALVKTNSDLVDNRKYLDEAKKSTDGTATSIDEYGKKTKEAGDKSQEFGEKSKSAINDLASAMAAAGLAMAFNKIKDAIVSCVDASVDFESAMTGVAKTTDLSDYELAAMGETLKDLSTRIPITANELANITEAAGQLGIAKNDLVDFTTVMANLGVATNLSSTEAAASLARFANVVKMQPENYERLGSSIVALGNNFATTERDIVEMATRLSSTGAIIGLTEPQIMGIATALSSVGIEAQAGGTAFSKLLKQFEVMVETGSDKLEGFADVAGMTSKEFEKAWREDAVAAVAEFINGLGRMDAAGGSAVATLDELGVTEVRLSNAVLAMASSGDLLTRALDLSNKAWEENTALTKEAELRYGTTESKMQIFKNSLDNLKIAIGDQLTPAIAGFVEGGTDMANWATDFIRENPQVVDAISALTVALGVLVVGIAAAKAAVLLLNAAMSINPFGMIAIAIAAVTAGLTVLVASIDRDALPSVKELTESARETNKVFEETQKTFEGTSKVVGATAESAMSYIKRLEELEKQGLKTKDSQMEYQIIVDKLNALIPELNIKIDEQTGLIIGGTKALKDQTQAWKDIAIEQAIATKYKDEIEAWAAAELELYENKIDLKNAIEEENKLNAESARLRARINDIERERAEIVAAGDYDKEQERLSNLNSEYWKTYDVLNEVNSTLVENKKQQDTLNEAVGIGEEAVGEYEGVLKKTQDALEGFREAQNEAAQATENDATVHTKAAGKKSEAIKAINEDLTALAEKYKETYDAAFDSIEGQIGLFDEFEAALSEDTESVEQMMEIWAKQTENLGLYTENLKKAAEYGIDSGLVSSLADGSAQSAGYLATIIAKIEELGVTSEGLGDYADEFVMYFNESFAKTSEAKDSFASTVAEMATNLKESIAGMETAAGEVDFSDFKTAVKTSFENVGFEFEGLGLEVGDGFKKGIEGSTPAAEETAKETAKLTMRSFKDILKIPGGNAPSEETKGVGTSIISGLVDGVKGEEPKLTSLIKKTGSKTTDIMKTGGAETVREFTSEFGKISSASKLKLDELKLTVKSTTSHLPGEMRSIGVQMIDGMITGLNSGESTLYSTISRIVNQSIEKAKTAAAVASPSKKTIEIGENLSLGLAIGAEKESHKASDAMQKVIDGMLSFDVATPLKVSDRAPDISAASIGGAGGQSYNIENKFIIESMQVREDKDVDRIAEQLYKHQKREMRKRGLVNI